MYFSSKITIDPSQVTRIENVQPKPFLDKILYFFSAGDASLKQEIETFTAFSILQQFHSVFRSIGMHDIVRLSVDTEDFYLDELGIENDLQATIDQFRAELEKKKALGFEKLYLVLEHDSGSFKYLISVLIRRTHQIGVYPINVQVNGLLKEFAVTDEQPMEKVLKKMGNYFSKPLLFEHFQVDKQQEFEQFIKKVEVKLKKFIRIDDVVTHKQVRVLMPHDEGGEEKPISYSRYADPAFHGYAGIDSYILYIYRWFEQTKKHHLKLKNVEIYDEFGGKIHSVGNKPFDPEKDNLGEIQILSA